MVFKDLFGKEVEPRVIKLSVFHDEREIKKQWLYHGFLFIQQRSINSFVNNLIKYREKIDFNKELKFVNLKNTNKENLLAEEYIKTFFSSLLNGEIFFYFFGINYKNLEKGIWKNQKTRNFKIYNRFFQIGLYGALSWFFKNNYNEIKIYNIFSDRRIRQKEDYFHISPIKETEFKASIKGENIKFLKNIIIELDSDHNKENRYPHYSHIIQLVDLLIGGFSQIFDFTSRHKGKCKIADLILSKGLPKEIMGYKSYNFESVFYKRCCVSFFPKKRLKKEEILNNQIKNKINNFYNERNIKYSRENQLEVFPSKKI